MNNSGDPKVAIEEEYRTIIRQVQSQQRRQKNAFRRSQEEDYVDKRKHKPNLDAAGQNNGYLYHGSGTSSVSFEQHTVETSLPAPHVIIEKSHDLQVRTQLTIPIAAYVLPHFTVCEHCGAKKFYRESKGFCCSDGKVKLRTHSIPDDLFQLFTSSCQESTHFRTVCRSYNNHFAFTSFGVKYDKELCKSNKGIYTFRVQGQVYHYVNPLLPRDDAKPSYMQLYFYDTENEVQNRLHSSDRFLETVLVKIIESLKTNPYSRFFRSLNDKENLDTQRIQIRCHPGLDQRVYNTPVSSQVAAIWVEDDPCANIRARDISICGHSGIERTRNANEQPQCVSEVLVDVNTLVYPEQLIQRESEVLNYGKKRYQISCREYYCYKLQIRPSGRRMWTTRKQQIVIGRVVAASPNEGERYFLRVLLNHIKGPLSFEHLKTVNGVNVATYREAALLHGLLSGDNHCEECMSEAVVYQMPGSLRRLFATLLTLCNPTNPKMLWEKFKTNMFEDYIQHGLQTKHAEQKTLYDISSILETLGKNVNDYAIVSYIVALDDNERLNRMIAEETISLDIESGISCETKLNEEQRTAFNTIMGSLVNEVGAVYFVDGPGGTDIKAFLSDVNHALLSALDAGYEKILFQFQISL